MKRQILAVSILLVATQLFGQESRFWVGGSGKWADNSHWATVSGGEPGATVPESGTSVVFDANSFSGAKNTVTLSDEVVIGSLTATDAEFVFSGKKDLTVGGSVSVDSKVDFGKLRGALVLSAEGNQTLNLPATLDGDIVFNGGNWTLASDLATEGNITLNAGSLNTAGHSVTCSVFTATENAEELDIRNSSMVTDKWFTNAANEMYMLAKGSTIDLRGNIRTDFRIADEHVYDNLIYGSAVKASVGEEIDVYDEVIPTCPVNSKSSPQGSTNNGSFKVKVGTNMSKKYEVHVERVGSNDTYTQTGNDIPFPNLKSGRYNVYYLENGITKGTGPDCQFDLGDSFDGKGIIVSKDALCYKEPIQELTVDVTGGTTPYKFTWEDAMGNTSVTTANEANSPSLSNVVFNSRLSVKIEDAKKCFYSFGYDYRDGSHNSYTTGPTEFVIDLFEYTKACDDMSNGKITVVAQGGTGTNIDYEYKLGDGDWKSGVVIDNVKAGTYTVIVRDSNDCPSKSKKAVVGKNLRPEPNLCEDATICEDTEYPLSSDPKNCSSFEWEGTVSDPESKTPTYTPSAAAISAGSVTLKLTAKDTTNCPDSTESVTLTIVKKTKPTMVTGSVRVCGLDTTLNVTPTDASNDLVVECTQKPDGAVVTKTGLYVKVSKAGTYKFKVVEKNGECAGCDGETSEVELTFYDAPDVTIIQKDAAEICAQSGKVVSAIAQSTCTTITWSMTGGANTEEQLAAEDAGSGEINRKVNYEVDVVNDLNQDITLTATARNSTCPATATDSYTFTVLPVPAPEFVYDAGKPDSILLCGKSGEIKVKKITTGDVRWIKSDNVEIKDVNVSGGELTATAELKSGAAYGVYAVSMVEKNSAGCEDTITAQVKFMQEPVMEFKDNIYSASICAGDSFNIVVTKHENYTGCTWTSGGASLDGDLDGASYTSLVSTQRKVLNITATPNGGCTVKGGKAFTLTIEPLPDPNTSEIETDVCGLVYELPELVSSVTDEKGNSIPTSIACNGTIGLDVVTDLETGKTTLKAAKTGSYGLVINETLQKGNLKCKNAEKSVTIHFTASPKTNIGTYASVCNYDEYIVFDKANPTDYVSLEWSSSTGGLFYDENDNVNNTVKNPKYKITAADTANGYVAITLSMVGLAPCNETTDTTITIMINKPDVREIVGMPTACKDVEQEYSIVSGMRNYKWFVDGNEQTGETSATFNYVGTVAGETHSITVTYTDKNSCKVTTVKEKLVTTKEVKLAHSLPDTVKVCTNGYETLDATATGGSGNYSYSWTGTNVGECLDSDDSPIVEFAIEEAGEYILNCHIEDDDFGCELDTTIVVINKQAPWIKVGDDIQPICYGGKFENSAAAISAGRGIDAGAYSLVEWSVTTGGSFNGTETSLNAEYEPSEADFEAGFVKFQIVLTDTVTPSCGSLTQYVNVPIAKKINSNVGSVEPFKISASTKIEVRVKGEHESGYDLAFFLVAPDGTTLKLYDHKNDLGSSGGFADWGGDFNILFSTEPDAAPLDFSTEGASVEGKYQIAGNRSAIYGKNPAEGGWSVLVKDQFSLYEGLIKQAVISFTDIDYEGKLKTVTFDSKEIPDEQATIYDDGSTAYVSPIGLHVDCYGDSIFVVIKPTREGDLTAHSYDFVWATSSDFNPSSIIAETYGKTVDTLKLKAQKYYISITDEIGCSTIDSFEIQAPEKIMVGLVSNDSVRCYDEANGSLKVNVSNVGAIQSDFAFSWTEKGKNVELSDSATAVNLKAGEYVVRVTNKDDKCWVDTSFVVGQPDAPLTVEIIADSVKPASCGGDPNGQVMFIANGGTRNYSLFADGILKDSDKADTLAATGLAGKKVEFKIKDARGCELDTAVSVAPDTLSLEYAITEGIKCPDDSATVKVTVKNAKPSDTFTYKWDDGEETSASTMKLIAGVHKVEVAPFGTTCFTELPITVKDARSITNKITYTDSIKCYGDETASFYVKADSNGVVSGNYTYSWKDDFGRTWNDTAVTNVGVGKYYLTIMTEDGCEIYDTVEVKGPDSKLEIDHSKVMQTALADCGEENGSVTALGAVSGGLKPANGYNFQWILQSDETKKKNGQSITAGIGAGFYKIVVTDLLGCKATDTLTVKDNGQVDFNYEIVKSVTCKEREDAQIRISQVMENGAAASSFKLEWINKSGYSQIGYSQNDTTITNVGNNATLTITTAHGCSTEALIEALGDSTLRFIEPITNYPDMNGTPERANGSLTVKVAGGIGAYAYDWSVEVPGNEITAVNIENTDSTTTLKKRMAGKYHLSVTDESSCSIDTTLEVKYEPIDAIVTIDSVKCKGTDGGKVKLTGFGGYDGVDYVFHWVKTTDANSVPVESEPMIKEGDEATFTNLTAGWYECLIWQLDSSLVRVRDTSIWVGEPTIALRVPNDSITIDSTYCYATSGAITVKAPADSAAAYDIYNGYYPLTISVKNSQNDVIAPTGLAAGWYTIHVEDALGCEYDKAVEVGDKSKFEVKANDVDLRCFGSTNGKVEVEASIENASAFTYSWMKWIDSKGDTLPLPGTVISEDSVVKGLAAGAYIVNVTVNVDNHTCVKSDTAYVNQPDSISFKLSNVKDNTCFTKADGIVRLDSLNGGFKVPNRKYEMFIFMSDDNNIYDANNELTNRYIVEASVAVDSSFTFEGHLLTGEHKVVVVDEGGCLSDTIAFTVSSLPRVSFAVSNIEPNSCYNSNDGEVKLENLQGGVEKYNFFEVLDVNKNVLFSDSMMVVSKPDSIGTDTTAIFAPGLTVGKYLVRVADTSDCFSEYDTLQVFTKRPRIVLDTIIENVLPECGMFKKDGSVSNEGVVTAFASKLMTPDVKTMGADLKLFFKVDDGEFKADSVLTKLTAGKHNITISYADTLCADTVYAFNLGAKSNLVADAHFIGTPKAIFTCPDKELTAYVESGENGGPFSYKFYTLSDEEAEKLLPVEPAPEPAKEEKPVENNTAVEDSTTNTADTVAYRYNRGIYFRADSVPAVDTTGNPAVTDTVPVLLPVYDHQTIRGRMVSVLASGSREDGSVKVSGDTWRAYADDIKPYGYETFYYFEITNDQCISVDSIKATALRPVEDLQIIVDMEDVTSDELLIDGEYQVPEGGLLTLTANQLEFEFSDNIFAYAENGWLWQSAPADNNESSTSGLFIGRIETTSPSMNENPLVAQGYGRFIAKVWDSVRFELSDYSEGVYRISDTTLTCSYYDTVVVNAESTIKPRKVFTPNGDGHNDTWKIAGMASYDKATIYVFNRWGGRVWQYSGSGREYDTKEWDGRNEKNKPVPSGTYYYVIQCSDGVLGGKKVTGPVTIIR